MIVHFPDLDTLQLTLTSGIVPPDVARKPAVAGFGDEEQVWVETAAKLPAAVQRELKRFGALVCKSSDAALNMEVSCWLELLPLVPDDAPLDALEKTPVLFDVSSGEELSLLVLEMMRLGNDRQSYRRLEETNGRAESRPHPECRALLRVVGPPYYSLLRAIDRIGGPGVAPHAFVEQAPGVWVEAGYRHPLAANIKPPKGRILLLRPPRHWLMLPDAPFRDIYEIVEFQLPNGVTAWKDSPLPHRLTVAPRLRQAGSADGGELWVLRGEAVDDLNRFVQNAEDHLLNRLAFAVGEKHGQTIVVLRVRQSKVPPPILVLTAESYKSYLKLPNLFLPTGYILHPPLRRDVVRKLLAEDAGRVAWLVAGENGRFAPESLPEDVFRPLTDWVDYVLDCNRENLHAWVQAMQFDFEPFVCDEEEQSKPKKPPDAEKSRRRKGAPVPPATASEADEMTAFEVLPDSATEDIAPEAFAVVERVETSEIEKELHAVEQEFLSLPNGLEDESRQALWPRLAQLNDCLMRTEDAVICTLNALWDANAADKWAAAWFRTEALGVAHRHLNDSTLPQSWLAGAVTTQGIRRDVNDDDLDRLPASTEPATADVRALAAYIVCSARREPGPAALVRRLPEVQRFLERHEHLLPVRACWLAWHHLVQLTDGDVLALARARDRLLERLFQQGLRPELDLPSFLRFAGQPSGRRFREVCAWMTRTCETARKWVDANGDILDRKPPTKTYADLFFAFGLARLGETEGAKHLLQRARAAFGKEDTVHRFLVRAFESRIQTVLDGKPHTGPLPQALLDELESMDRLHRYVVERVRHNSRILEPDRQVNPYRHWAARLSELDQALTDLVDLSERPEIRERLRALLRKTPKGTAGREDRAKIVRVGLELGPHIGEEFAREMLDQTLPVFNALPEPPDSAAIQERAKFLEKALFTAAHFGCTEHVHPLIARFREMLQAQRGPQAIDAVALLAEQSLRSLRKLGMRDRIDQLLGEMADFVLQGKDVDTMTRSFNAKKDAINPLIALLHVAGSWYYFGRDQLAEPVVRAARTILIGGELMQPNQRRDLACAYARTVGQAPLAVALPRLEELFANLKSYRDSFTTSDYFSVVQMDLIESVVLAVVTDDFTQDGETSRRLDEDEYLVRQRIHADVRNLMAQT